MKKINIFLILLFVAIFGFMQGIDIAEGASRIRGRTVSGDLVFEADDGQDIMELERSDYSVKMHGVYKIANVPVVYASGVGYTISGTSPGTIFEIPLAAATEQGESDDCTIGPAGSGITVNIPTPTSATDGRIIGVLNTSGTTAPIIYMAGLPITGASGTTIQMGEDKGDITWLQLQYNSSVSAFTISEYKAD